MSGFLDCLNGLFKNFNYSPPVTADGPKPQAPSKYRILGIDVSHYEPPLDWAQAKAGGVEWMYTKASEGVSFVDKLLHQHVGSARGGRVLTGAYHFFHASMDGEKQAQHFLSTIDGLALDLPPCLDWETSSSDGQPAEAQKYRALAWLNAVERATGKVPVIYGGESFLRSLKLGDEFLKYPLWLAHYGVNEKDLKIPKPWSNFTMWQYTDAESVPGLSQGHHVDANWFQGNLDDLKKFAGIV